MNGTAGNNVERSQSSTLGSWGVPKRSGLVVANELMLSLEDLDFDVDLIVSNSREGQTTKLT